MSNKFETNELLKDGKLYTPIPKFFFRLWQKSRDLPPSFWCTLMYILDTTLGGSKEGIEGHLAQSQIPVDPHESSRWIAAMAGYGRLLEVTYSDGRNQKGSKFKLNPMATEDDWVDFVFALRVAYRDRVLSRDKKPEEVREIFKRYSEEKSFTLWSEMLRCIVNDETMSDEVRGDWKKRGFDMRAFREYTDKNFVEPIVNDDDAAVELIFMEMCHSAWIAGHNVMFPESEIEDIRKHHEQLNGKPISDEAWAKLLARFQKAQDPEWGPCLQNDWLAREWARAEDRQKVVSPVPKQRME